MDYAAFFFMYRTARLICDRLSSVISMSVSALLLSVYFEGGNLTEEYAMLFIACSLYIFLDYFLNDHITFFRLITCGFCLGCVCLLRINMISLWAVFCIAVLIRIIRQKSWEDLKKYLFPFVMGFMSIIAIFTVWLVYHHAFSSFFDQYFLFNLRYSSFKETTTFISCLHCIVIFLRIRSFFFLWLYLCICMYIKIKAIKQSD